MCAHTRTGDADAVRHRQSAGEELGAHCASRAAAAAESARVPPARRGDRQTHRGETRVIRSDSETASDGERLRRIPVML